MVHARLALMSVVNGEGKRLFPPNQLTRANIEKFGNAWQAGAIEKIFNEAYKLSLLRPEDLRDAEGNSEATQSEPSISD